MVLSLWAATLLSLYIRVQVNILGRHLYIDTARGIGGSGQFGLRALLIGKNGFRPLARKYWISSHVETEPRSRLDVLIGDMLILILMLPGTSLEAFITIPISHEKHYEVYVGLFVIPLLAIKVVTSAMDNSHSVTSGVFKARSIDDKS
ncbi:hypothetical protein H5410_062155, partial [Solanum commersonii]